MGANSAIHIFTWSKSLTIAAIACLTGISYFYSITITVQNIIYHTAWVTARTTFICCYYRVFTTSLLSTRINVKYTSFCIIDFGSMYLDISTQKVGNIYWSVLILSQGGTMKQTNISYHKCVYFSSIWAKIISPENKAWRRNWIKCHRPSHAQKVHQICFLNVIISTTIAESNIRSHCKPDVMQNILWLSVAEILELFSAPSKVATWFESLWTFLLIKLYDN